MEDLDSVKEKITATKEKLRQIRRKKIEIIDNLRKQNDEKKISKVRNNINSL